MNAFHLHDRRRRARGALLVIFLGLGGLGLSFFQTQVLRTDAFALQSESNRLRPLSIPAPRGTVFDRHGEVVADNVPGYALSVLPASRDSMRATLERLAPVLDFDEDRVEALLARYRTQPNQPLLVSSDLTFEQVSALEEQRPMHAGVFIETRPKRRYPPGPTVGHLVGYVAEIDERELALPLFEGYSPGRLVGKTGLERQYERVLAGTPGTRYIEVDAYGRIVGELETDRRVEAVPGRDLHLHLDLGLQRWIEAIFPDSMRGSIVALEPGTGHVLAMYSSPSYDPNDFVDGVDPARWRALNSDPGAPLLNRASSGRYPPGSTFKLFTAAIALDLGAVDPDATMPIPCRGGMPYGNRYFRCWDNRGHGFLDLADAIKHSCNVYFYQLGLKIGLERFLAEASRLGFASRTGVDLPVERAGVFPDGPEWYRRRWGWMPTPTEVLSLAIGQGANDQTPLKMAQLFAALAADGSVPAPRLAAGVDVPEGQGVNLEIAPASLEVLREGLRGVTSRGGTAYTASLEHWDFIGKTGTAQNPHGENHGWFVAMAGPRDGEPEIVVSVIVEFGESGSAVAQYAAKAADYYLRRKHGIPVDSVQTLREHIDARRPVTWAR